MEVKCIAKKKRIEVQGLLNIHAKSLIWSRYKVAFSIEKKKKRIKIAGLKPINFNPLLSI